MKTIVLLLIASFYCNVVLADSFLTSTEFSKAYQNKRIVKFASKSSQLNEKLIKYILKKRKPIALKLAIINQLGWDHDGVERSEVFLGYLIKNNLFRSYEDLLDNSDADILICLAYMKAMDDYFDVKEAKYIARKAKSMDSKNSYALNLVCALIEAQDQQLASDFCKAYQLCDAVRKDKSLQINLADNAKKIVFDYVDLYEEYCN